MDFNTDDLEKDQKRKKRGRGLSLTSRQVSWTLSFFIFTWFLVFTSGYFLGKKKAAEKFYNKMSQESLSDHIYYSVCSIYDNNENGEKQQSTEESSVLRQAPVFASPAPIRLRQGFDGQGLRRAGKASTGGQDERAVGVTGESQMLVGSEVQVESKAPVESKILRPASAVAKASAKDERYYAELIGFGTHRAANKFVEKLKKRNFSVVLKKRKSKTSKGKTIVWYQVVTEKFDNKNDLIAFVDILKDKEKLKGVRIIQC